MYLLVFDEATENTRKKIDIEIQSSFDNIQVIQNVERIGLRK